VGYYDRLAEVTFKKDQRGRDVFFPFGAHGKGRVLPDAAAAARIRRRIKTAIRTTLVVAAVLLISLFFFFDVTPMTALVGVMLMIALALTSRYLLTWPLVRSLPISDEKLTSREVHERTLAAYGRDTFVRFLAFANFLFWCGVLLLLASACAFAFLLGFWLNALVPNRKIISLLYDIAPVMFALGTANTAFAIWGKLKIRRILREWSRGADADRP
jgi:hypothetical protein